jgi:hypothetical protein
VAKPDFTKPVYEIDGRYFKTVNGLCGYLLKKHAAAEACSVTGVRKDRTLAVQMRGSTGFVPVATYSVSAPEIGKPMTLREVQ